MALYNDLDAIFPSHQYFYAVNATDMSEALDKCARLVGDHAHVINYNGQLYMSSHMDLGNEISWARPVDGNPTE
jgi:hypothetical protein